jgi:Subtilase family
MASSVALSKVPSALVALTLAVALSALPAPGRAAAAGKAGSANDRVIVVLRSQPAAATPGTAASAARWAAIAGLQAPLIRQLRQGGARNFESYRLVDAFAATVSAAQEASLTASSQVAEVVPDIEIRQAPVPAPLPPPPPKQAKPAPASEGPTPHVIPDACPANGQVMLEPEALLTTNTASGDPATPTARSLGITGAGVKVAFIADGLDPDNVNFIRADGRSVFNRSFGGDYQDFSGDGPDQLTVGAEAFLDANSIAGQGRHVYSLQGFSAQPEPSACDIRIEGMAPGAELIGLDVFGTFEMTPESNFLQAIDYAVERDHANVLNESFGAYPVPNAASLDVLEQFNDAAVAAGTTVTVSAGDAGSTNTIASPASDPDVISVGASTTFGFYAMTNYAAARYFATKGWLDDNVSALSSAGFTASGGTVSLVAPGDLGFASCSLDVDTYTGCVNLNDEPSPVELSGGTSESAPLTAGAAALVIQAYRQTHRGATPDPTLVKQILTSTATDLGLPADEQGSGLLNSYKAVLAAESVKTSAAAPTPVGDTLLFSRSELNATAQPGARKIWRLKVVNSGSTGQLITATGRTFGPDEDVQTGTVKLEDGKSPEFTDASGYPENYETFHFSVRPGANRLNVSIAYRSPTGGFDPYGMVWLTLIDPDGRFAANSLPQGTSNYGNVDVRAPAAGTWTGVIFGLTAAGYGTNGTIPWRVATQRFVGFGSVTPRAFYLPAGQTRVLHVTERAPAEAGDVAGAIVVRSGEGGVDPYVGPESQSIPVTLRAMIDVAHGGRFGGVLTGGNGRPPGIGQVSYFEFRVGRGYRSLTANVSLTRDKADDVGSYLIAPDGQALGFGQNEAANRNGLSLTAYSLDPAPGIWTLVVDFSGLVTGDVVSQPFHGDITLDTTKAVAPRLPDSSSRQLKPKVPVTFRVWITNTGAAPEDYFLDARLAESRPVNLLPIYGTAFLLPLEVEPEWYVPTQISSISLRAKGTVPIEFDWGPGQGDPDLFGPPSPGDRAASTYAPGGEVQPGYWVAGPDQFGPYPHGAREAEVWLTLKAIGKPFDPAVTASTGDLWLSSVTPVTPFEPVTIRPGRSGEIGVTIRPQGAPGTVVRGVLYVNDYLPSVPPLGQSVGDELVAIPYKYKIK